MKIDTSITPEHESQTADLYCLCMEAKRLDRLIAGAGEKLAEIMSANLVTFLDIESRRLHLVGPTIAISEQERVEAHARRCLEGADKSPDGSEAIEIIRHGEKTSEGGDQEETELLWTGAIERTGKLAGVLTVYGPQRSLTVSENRILRTARTIIGESIQRLSEIQQLRTAEPDASQVDMFMVTIDPEISRGDVTGLAMSKLQDAVAKRLATSIPDAFMVAKLGINRLMVVGHPDHPLSLDQWSVLCTRALQSLSERIGYPVDVKLTEGSLDNLSQVPICGLVSKPSIQQSEVLRETA